MSVIRYIAYRYCGSMVGKNILSNLAHHIVAAVEWLNHGGKDRQEKLVPDLPGTGKEFPRCMFPVPIRRVWGWLGMTFATSVVIPISDGVIHFAVNSTELRKIVNVLI